MLVSLMGSSILSEVDDTSILKTGLSTPLSLSSQLATGLSALAPAQRAGAQRLCAMALLFRPDAARLGPEVGVKLPIAATGHQSSGIGGESNVDNEPLDSRICSEADYGALNASSRWTIS